MKGILLDECLARKFKEHLPGYNCFTVTELGWAGKKNGELLSLIGQAGLRVFVILDRGISYQQNLSGGNIAVILIRAKSSRLADRIPRAAEILQLLAQIEAPRLSVV